jgi:hypothetical protein
MMISRNLLIIIPFTAKARAKNAKVGSSSKQKERGGHLGPPEKFSKFAITSSEFQPE